MGSEFRVFTNTSSQDPAKRAVSNLDEIHTALQKAKKDHVVYGKTRVLTRENGKATEVEVVLKVGKARTRLPWTFKRDLAATELAFNHLLKEFDHFPEMRQLVSDIHAASHSHVNVKLPKGRTDFKKRDVAGAVLFRPEELTAKELEDVLNKFLVEFKDGARVIDQGFTDRWGQVTAPLQTGDTLALNVGNQTINIQNWKAMRDYLLGRNEAVDGAHQHKTGRVKRNGANAVARPDIDDVADFAREFDKAWRTHRALADDDVATALRAEVDRFAEARPDLMGKAFSFDHVLNQNGSRTSLSECKAFKELAALLNGRTQDSNTRLTVRQKTEEVAGWIAHRLSTPRENALFTGTSEDKLSDDLGMLLVAASAEAWKTNAARAAADMPSRRHIARLASETAGRLIEKIREMKPYRLADDGTLINDARKSLPPLAGKPRTFDWGNNRPVVLLDEVTGEKALRQFLVADAVASTGSGKSPPVRAPLTVVSGLPGGGAVLMNASPRDVDLLDQLGGMPRFPDDAQRAEWLFRFSVFVCRGLHRLYKQGGALTDLSLRDFVLSHEPRHAHVTLRDPARLTDTNWHYGKSVRSLADAGIALERAAPELLDNTTYPTVDLEPITVWQLGLVLCELFGKSNALLGAIDAVGLKAQVDVLKSKNLADRSAFIEKFLIGTLPDEFHGVLAQMLDPDPAARPSLEAVMQLLVPLEEEFEANAASAKRRHMRARPATAPDGKPSASSKRTAGKNEQPPAPTNSAKTPPGDRLVAPEERHEREEKVDPVRQFHVTLGQIIESDQTNVSERQQTDEKAKAASSGGPKAKPLYRRGDQKDADPSLNADLDELQKLLKLRKRPQFSGDAKDRSIVLNALRAATAYAASRSNGETTENIRLKGVGGETPDGADGLDQFDASRIDPGAVNATQAWALAQSGANYGAIAKTWNFSSPETTSRNQVKALVDFLKDSARDVVSSLNLINGARAFLQNFPGFDEARKAKFHAFVPVIARIFVNAKQGSARVKVPNELLFADAVQGDGDADDATTSAERGEGSENPGARDDELAQTTTSPHQTIADLDGKGPAQNKGLLSTQAGLPTVSNDGLASQGRNLRPSLDPIVQMFSSRSAQAASSGAGAPATTPTAFPVRPTDPDQRASLLGKAVSTAEQLFLQTPGEAKPSTASVGQGRDAPPQPRASSANATPGQTSPSRVGPPVRPNSAPDVDNEFRVRQAQYAKERQSQVVGMSDEMPPLPSTPIVPPPTAVSGQATPPPSDRAGAVLRAQGRDPDTASASASSQPSSSASRPQAMATATGTAARPGATAGTSPTGQPPYAPPPPADLPPPPPPRDLPPPPHSQNGSSSSLQTQQRQPPVKPASIPRPGDQSVVQPPSDQSVSNRPGSAEKKGAAPARQEAGKKPDDQQQVTPKKPGRKSRLPRLDRLKLGGNEDDSSVVWMDEFNVEGSSTTRDDRPLLKSPVKQAAPSADTSRGSQPGSPTSGQSATTKISRGTDHGNGQVGKAGADNAAAKSKTPLGQNSAQRRVRFQDETTNGNVSSRTNKT